MQTLSFNQQIESELNEREWDLFHTRQEWSEQQRNAWRAAWRTWRQNQLSAIHNGEAFVHVAITPECIGCFDCEIMCPEIFHITKQRSRIKKEILQLNANNQAYIDPTIININWSNLQLAKEACPVEAIHINALESIDQEPTPDLFN